jgi:Tol biopolymer transport system component
LTSEKYGFIIFTTIKHFMGRKSIMAYQMKIGFGLFLLLSILTSSLYLVGCSSDDSATDDDSAINPPSTPLSPRLVFNSRRSGEAQLYSMLLNGDDVHQITSTESTFGASNHDATLVTYESIRSDQQDLFVANYDGIGEVQLTNDTFSDYRPVFSPAGNRIAFVSTRGGANNDRIYRDIWLIDSDGKNLLQLTTADGEDTFPVFSHDGQKVFFVSYRNGNTQVYAVNIDGTGEVNLSNNAFEDGTPFADPSGNHILFVSNRTGEYEFWTMANDGSSQSQLLTIAGNEFHPSYTADGKQIIYFSEVEGYRRIYIVEVIGGSEPVALTGDTEGSFKTGTLIAP